MSKTNSSDEQLIKSISEGEEMAFDELYSRYEEKLMGFLMYKVRNIEVAQDIFQIVWSKVVKNSHNFKTGHQFSSWLMTIASNQTKNWFKKSCNYSRLLENFHKDAYSDNEEKKALPDLSFLKEQSQKVLLLRFVKGFSSKEVAKELELSESNVRKISSRALKDVKKHIENGGQI